MKLNCHECGTRYVKVNGRTLKSRQAFVDSLQGIGKFTTTDWVELCPSCNFASATCSIPFLCQDGVMRTILDFNRKKKIFDSDVMDFCGLKFSGSALRSAIEAQESNRMLRKVLDAGEEVLRTRSVKSVLGFSELVCAWGGGQRVWANLKRHNGPKLGKVLVNWIRFAIENDDAETVILEGAEIKGLGISFASKHLRMLSPDRYAVLDDVLNQGLGFALNGRGYVFFLRCLREFIDEHDLKMSVGTFESGIFLLVRQIVRSK